MDQDLLGELFSKVILSGALFSLVSIYRHELIQKEN